MDARRVQKDSKNFRGAFQKSQNISKNISSLPQEIELSQGLTGEAPGAGA
jgi:hypothetical protein